MTDTPDDYWCAVPELAKFNLTTTQIKHLSIPIIEVISEAEGNRKLGFQKKNCKSTGRWCFKVQSVLAVRNRLAADAQ